MDDSQQEFSQISALIFNFFLSCSGIWPSAICPRLCLARAGEDSDERGAPLTKTLLRNRGGSAERLVPWSDGDIQSWRDFSMKKNTI